ncbi:Na+/H+ antiporter NhaC [Gallaecimonas pentaromativorans]|uniref:Transporter (NhaC family) n=1 Tax=Gallaecimonas pentaromativorans TaxID=584787 RepID=A0A3N1PK29_9GAMM|nr:Na+/H+ antiporter NhaC [Gallaecimonas pentaromativorans]MED5525402.1 Na+/H+ antiporter NhaC [Pseudomonadota bacterium]ROQ27541.1 transporter (NhaC family) [Gallaecimonas pentaromativorans]
MKAEIKAPSLLDAIIPVVVLIALLAASVTLFHDDSSYGPNQIALLLSAMVAAIIALKNGHQWHDIEKGIIKGISISLGAVLILLAVGALIGTWLLAGTVPSLIYFGLKILNPSIFYAATCLICAVVSLAIGSSWTTAATIGVALMGVAGGLGLSPAATAGAVVSGAYFGDKISPLSETTNLAPAVAGSDLFSHIRHMMWTTVPSFVLALIIFMLLGLGSQGDASSERIDAILTGLTQNFDISAWHLVPLVALLVMAMRKMPAFPAVFIGALLGGVWALLFQGELVHRLGGEGLVASLKLVWTTLFNGISIETGNATLDKLLSGGGMSSMLNTVWLIMCAMSFGAVMERTGLLTRLIRGLLGAAKSAGSLIAATIATCIGCNILTADQYMAIVMPGRMFKEEYERRGLAPVNLSRSLEDGGTITSPLVPWNTCGAYMHSVLHVSPADYIFYALFNLINPVLAVIYAYLGVKILRLSPPAAGPAQ